MKIKDFLNRALVWILWFLSAAVCFAILIVGRDVFFHYFTLLLKPSTYVARLVDKVYYIVFGLAWLVIILVIENYFSGGARKKDTVRRIFWVTGIEFLILCALWISLIVGGLLFFTTFNVTVVAITLVVGVGCIFLAQRVFKHALPKTVPPTGNNHLSQGGRSI